MTNDNDHESLPRDVELGRALDHVVPTPEHGPDFFANLEARLTGKEAPAPKPPAVEELERPDAVSREPKPTLIDVAQSTSGRKRAVFGGLSIAAVVLVVVGIAFVPRGSNDDDQLASGPVTTTMMAGDSNAETATAAVDVRLASQLGAQMRRSTAVITGVSGTLVTTGNSASRTQEFRLSSNGNAWSSDPASESGTTEVAYRADTATFEQLQIDGPQVQRFVGDSGYGINNALPEGLRRLQQSVTAVLNGGDAPVSAVTFNNQSAWRVTVPTNVDGLGPNTATRAVVTVDRTMGFPVAIEYRDDGNQLLRRIEIQNLTINPTFTDASFAVSRASGTPVTTNTGTFKAFTVAQAAIFLGYPPALPQTLPDGFERTQLFAAKNGAAETMATPSFNIVEATYRQGLNSFTVTNRENAGLDQGGATRNPFFNFDGANDVLTDHAITGGLLDGQVAHLVKQADGAPYAWVAVGDKVYTVAGDLTDDELISVLTSL